MPIAWKALHGSCQGPWQWPKSLPHVPALSTRHKGNDNLSLTEHAGLRPSYHHQLLPGSGDQCFSFLTFKRASCWHGLSLPQNVPVAQRLHWKTVFHDIVPKFFFLNFNLLLPACCSSLWKWSLLLLGIYTLQKLEDFHVLIENEFASYAFLNCPSQVHLSWERDWSMSQGKPFSSLLLFRAKI